MTRLNKYPDKRFSFQISWSFRFSWSFTVFCLKFFFLMVPTQNAGKRKKKIPIISEDAARKRTKNVSQRIKNKKGSKETMKNMSLTPLNLRSSKK